MKEGLTEDGARTCSDIAKGLAGKSDSDDQTNHGYLRLADGYALCAEKALIFYSLKDVGRFLA